MIYEEKEFNVKEFNRCLSQLGILLGDENGLLRKTMQRNFDEEMMDIMLNEGIVEAFECMYDEVNRINDILYWHDEVCAIRDENIQFSITENPNDLDLKQFDNAELLHLKDRVNGEILQRELDGELIPLERNVPIDKRDDDESEEDEDKAMVMEPPSVRME